MVKLIRQNMFCAVIVAAGNSRRAGYDKLAIPLAGVPVLRRSIDAFIAARCSAIVVVCPESRWRDIGLDSAVFPVSVIRTDGGVRRQDSVAAGLEALPADAKWVAVHDGARPLISPQGIHACLEEAMQTAAAACAHPIVDTLKRADADDCTLAEQVSREGLWGMETPQIFDIDLLRKAYSRVAELGLEVTDEVSAMEVIGVATRLIHVGPNIKITLPGDIVLAELIYKNRT